MKSHRQANYNIFLSGISLFLYIMSIAFLGYVLPFGQMSFWGATVIINLLSPFPSLIEFLCGTYSVYNPTLKRFFLFHFQFPKDSGSLSISLEAALRNLFTVHLWKLKIQ